MDKRSQRTGRAWKTWLQPLAVAIGLTGFAACATTGLAQQKPAPTGLAILDDAKIAAETPMPDFSYAGYRFGLADLPGGSGTVILATDHGVIPDDELDDSVAVLSALRAAHAVDGPVILQLPAGRIIISEILKIERSHFILRGMGMGEGGTELYFPRPLAMMRDTGAFNEIRKYLVKYEKRQREKASNVDMLFSEYSWTGGFIWVQKPGTRAAAYLEENDTPALKLADVTSGKRGERRVRVSDTSALKVGDVVALEWYNRDGPDGALLDQIYGPTDLEIGSHHWTYKDRALVVQPTRITAIDGTWVTIGDPLLHDINAEVPAQFSQWEHMVEVGIEDFKISFPDAPSFGHHLEQGYNGIYLTSVFDSWIRSIAIENADSGILTYNSASFTIETIRTTGARRAHYAVHFGDVHNALARDLVIENPVIHSLTFNTRSTRSVFLRAIVFETPSLDQHAGSNHQNLFDDVTVYVSARRGEGGPFFNVWDGSGAPYWQPGHGRYNVTWNLKVMVIGGAARDETVRLIGAAEGPEARIVGVTGNRPFTVDYTPAPYVEAISTGELKVPSLYDHQLAARKREAAKPARR